MINFNKEQFIQRVMTLHEFKDFKIDLQEDTEIKYEMKIYYKNGNIDEFSGTCKNDYNILYNLLSDLIVDSVMINDPYEEYVEV